MGVNVTTPRNPKALVGERLRGAVPNTLGIGTFHSSRPSVRIQARGPAYAAAT